MLISWSRYAPGRITLATKYGTSQGWDNLWLPFLVCTRLKTWLPTWKALGVNPPGMVLSKCLLVPDWPHDGDIP
jgi:hypothetical protein